MWLNVAVLGKVREPGLVIKFGELRWLPPTPNSLLLLSDVGLPNMVFAPAPDGKEASQNLAVALSESSPRSTAWESFWNASCRNKRVTVWANPLATLACKLGLKLALKVPAVSVDQALRLLTEESKDVSFLFGSRNSAIAPLGVVPPIAVSVANLGLNARLRASKQSLVFSHSPARSTLCKVGDGAAPPLPQGLVAEREATITGGTRPSLLVHGKIHKRDNSRRRLAYPPEASTVFFVSTVFVVVDRRDELSPATAHRCVSTQGTLQHVPFMEAFTGVRTLARPTSQHSQVSRGRSLLLGQGIARGLIGWARVKLAQCKKHLLLTLKPTSLNR